MESKNGGKPNRLVDEKSPYLQQHAYNPVEWYPWGTEAFDAAQREDKPIFLSIGYSTCHWCHVMERESFEDLETAQMMNDLFINIKVDREERPDVDNVYMTAAQALTGSGGWPLSAWLTPELKPYYVGTYFPPRAAYGRPSFRDALLSLHDAWTNQREKVDRSAASIMEAIRTGAVVVAGEGKAVDRDDVIDRCFEQIERSYDPRHGGFSGAPKFPRPVIIDFLLRYYKERGKDHALDMSVHTLRMMAGGGMYDQLGGGFARYSVDAEWRVPHFEKMLYDQGQLLEIYSDACRITGDQDLARVIGETIDYLERDLMHESGAFYSAEDADSEGEEGTFYVWTRTELQEALSEDEFEVVQGYYGITEEGNFEHGKNVLHTSASIAEVSTRTGIRQEDVQAHLDMARQKLFGFRSRRVRPHRDEKILTSWNGLAISGLSRAAMALDIPRYADMARRAADTLIETMNVGGRLMHRQKDGEVKFTAYLEDYAFFIAGMLDLYEATFELRYLREAERLMNEANRFLWDEEAGGYFMTAGDDPSVLVRSKSDHDGAEPSGNSVMAINLLRLGRLFYDEDLLLKGEQTITLFLSRIESYPIMMPLLVAAALFESLPPRQIIIAASPDAANTRSLVRQAQSTYSPGTALVLLGADSPDEWLLSRIPTIEGMSPVDGKAAAYVCENLVCHRPVTELGGVSQ